VSSPSLAAVLLCTTGDLAGKKFELRADAVYIGRDSKKQIMVTDDARLLSDRYARIAVQNAAFQLAVLDPKSGMTVDGAAAKGLVALERLHVIGLGPQTEFVFRRSASTPAVAPTASPR